MICGMGRIPNGFVHKTLGITIIYLKCDHTCLCEFPILFSIVKLKLGRSFCQFVHRFKIWILKRWSWAVYTSNFFPIHKIEENLDF